jgi:hypothetical protein
MEASSVQVNHPSAPSGPVLFRQGVCRATCPPPSRHGLQGNDVCNALRGTRTHREQVRCKNCRSWFSARDGFATTVLGTQDAPGQVNAPPGQRRAGRSPGRLRHASRGRMPRGRAAGRGLTPPRDRSFPGAGSTRDCSGASASRSRTAPRSGGRAARRCSRARLAAGRSRTTPRTRPRPGSSRASPARPRARGVPRCARARRGAVCAPPLRAARGREPPARATPLARCAPRRRRRPAAARPAPR